MKVRSSRRCAAAAVVLALVGSAGPVRAGTAGDGDTPYWRTNLFRRVVTDQKFLVTRWWPQELHDRTFATALGLGVALALQAGTHDGRGPDYSWEHAISGNASPRVKIASQNLTRLGNGPAVAAILGIGYFAARRAHDDRLAEASSLAGESLLDAGIWITALKHVAGRVRPNQTEQGTFGQYGNRQSGSFPSGHSMAAFGVASVFAASYPDKKWVPVLSYGLAGLIGSSRIALGRHFPSDVLVGAVLGTSIGRGVVARAREEDRRVPGTFGPTLGPDGRGIGVGWSYSW